MSDALRTPAAVLGVALTIALLGLALFADLIAPGDPFASVAPPLSPPSRAHLMGSDDLGRDVLSGVIHGARTSVVVSLGVTAVAALIGIVVGAVAGYRSGGVDDLLGRSSERE